MFRTRLPLVASFISAVFVASFLSANAASIAGSTCSKLNSTKTVANIKYTCIKSGKKLYWNKGTLVVATSPTPTPSNEAFIPPIASTIPDSFSNLSNRSSQISYAAWKKIADQIAGSNLTANDPKIYIGPNTKPWNSNFAELMNLTIKAFPNAQQAKSVIWLVNNYQDLDWARKTLSTLISAEQLKIFNQNEGGDLFRSNCDPQIRNCLGSKQLTTQDDVAIIVVGVSNEAGTVTINGATYGNPGDEESRKTGQLIVHEYFHSFQRQVVFGKPLTEEDWPPEWLIEGSATLIQNAVVNHGNYAKFMNWRKIAHGNRFYKDPIDYEFIMDFLDVNKHKRYSNDYDSDFIYVLGARVMEALVAVGGTQSMLDIWEQLSTHVGFQKAFENVYGISYEKAKPILAQAIAKNILLTK